MQTYQAKLNSYASEMMVELLTLDMLIDSHRMQRAIVQRSEAEKRVEMQKAREFATAQATAEVKEMGWLSLERLRTMPMGELAELLRTD